MSNFHKAARMAAKQILMQHPEPIIRACTGKVQQRNAKGKSQHTVINPMRQIKKVMQREGRK